MSTLQSPPQSPLQKVSDFKALLSRLMTVVKSSDDTAAASRDAAFVFLVRVFNAGVLYLSHILLARWMGATEFGIFVYAWVWVILLGVLTPMGFSVSVIRFIAEYRENKQQGYLAGLLRLMPVMVFAFSTAISAIGAGLVYAFQDYLEAYHIVPLYFALACVPGWAMMEMNEGIARAHNWIKTAFTPGYVIRPVLILMILSGLLIAGVGLTGVTAMQIGLAAVALTLALQSIFLIRRLRATHPPAKPRYATWVWLKTSAPILIVSGYYMILANFDVIMLNEFATPATVAVYFAAIKTVSLVAFIRYAIVGVSSQRIAKLHAKNDQAGLRRFYHTAAGLMFWPTVLGAIVVLALGEFLLGLFGAGFDEGYRLMFIILPGLLVAAAVGPVEYLLDMTGRQNKTAMVLGAAIVLNIVLNLMLIPPLGAMGAALATSLSLIIANLVLAVIVRRHFGFWPVFRLQDIARLKSMLQNAEN